MKYIRYMSTASQYNRSELEKKFCEEQRIREARRKIQEKNDSVLERFEIQAAPYMPYVVSIMWIVAVVTAVAIVGSIKVFADLMTTQRSLLILSVTNIIMFAIALCATKVTSSKIHESNIMISEYREQLMTSLVDYIYEKDNEMNTQYNDNKQKLESEYKQKLKNLELEFKMKDEKLSFEYKTKELQLDNETTSIKNKFHQEELKINEERDRFEKVISSQYPFCALSELKSEALAMIFDKSVDYLKYKQRPALKAAEEIRFMKGIAKDAERRCSEMKYKYEFLINVFPELKDYVSDDRDLLKLSDAENYQDFEENIDNAKAFLSEEEWNKLSSTEKNQLALDRWWGRSEKTNREVGLLYEMYISYELRKKDFEVIEYGAVHGLEDLGRDVICKKNGKTYIIQCKNWSKDKVIHENVVCQLYGTTIEYELAHPNETVVPVLVSTTDLSETADKFAKKLNVVFKKKEMNRFPLIKCNVNNGEKIYHLPFDQQYWRTQIVDKYEFYAWTVKEAEEKEFRRAKRYVVS